MDEREIKLQSPQGSEGKEDHNVTNTWVTVPNPQPSQIKARFSITQIEVSPPSPGHDATEDFDEEFIQYLIDEGIPVKFLAKSESSEILDNAGIIRSPIPADTPANTGDGDHRDQLSPSNANDDVIQVTGMNQTMGRPIFLKYLPTIVDLPEESDNLSEPGEGNSRKHSVISGEVPIPLPMPPPSAAESASTMPIQKRVRFDLPNRKASIVGIYEYLPTSPSDNAGKTNLSHNELKEMRKSWFSPPPSPQRRFSEDEDLASVLESHNFLKRLLHDYRPSVDFSICEDQEEEDKIGRINDEEEIPQSEEQQPSDLRCGLYDWSPNWLQAFARKECYLAVFCMAGLVQGMFYTYNVAVISTLRKRFNFSSGVAGVILLGNDISQILLSILIAFFGTYGHRPRWMGIGAAISAMAAFVAATPHFIYGTGSIATESNAPSPTGFPAMTSKDFELCDHPSPETGCNENNEEQTYVFPAVLLFLSQFMVGTATSIFLDCRRLVS